MVRPPRRRGKAARARQRGSRDGVRAAPRESSGVAFKRVPPPVDSPDEPAHHSAPGVAPSGVDPRAPPSRPFAPIRSMEQPHDQHDDTTRPRGNRPAKGARVVTPGELVQGALGQNPANGDFLGLGGTGAGHLLGMAQELADDEAQRHASAGVRLSGADDDEGEPDFGMLDAIEPAAAPFGLPEDVPAPDIYARGKPLALRGDTAAEEAESNDDDGWEEDLDGEPLAVGSADADDEYSDEDADDVFDDEPIEAPALMQAGDTGSFADGAQDTIAGDTFADETEDDGVYRSDDAYDDESADEGAFEDESDDGSGWAADEGAPLEEGLEFAAVPRRRWGIGLAVTMGAGLLLTASLAVVLPAGGTLPFGLNQHVPASVRSFVAQFRGGGQKSAPTEIRVAAATAEENRTAPTTTPASNAEAPLANPASGARAPAELQTAASPSTVSPSTVSPSTVSPSVALPATAPAKVPAPKVVRAEVPPPAPAQPVLPTEVASAPPAAPTTLAPAAAAVEVADTQVGAPAAEPGAVASAVASGEVVHGPKGAPAQDALPTGAGANVAALPAFLAPGVSESTVAQQAPGAPRAPGAGSFVGGALGGLPKVRREGQLPEAQSGPSADNLPSVRVPTAVELSGRWDGEAVPPLERIHSTERMFTPEVGRVRVLTKRGDVFDGRLDAVGQGQVWLEMNLGSIALAGDTVARIERLPDVAGQPAKATDTATGHRVRVKTAGGVIFGRVLARDGNRVTILTDAGGRITLVDPEIEPADRRVPGGVLGGARGKP